MSEATDFVSALRGIAKRAPKFIEDGQYYMTVEGRQYTVGELQGDQGSIDRVLGAMQRFCVLQGWGFGLKTVPALRHIGARVLIQPEIGATIRYKATGDSSAHALSLALWDALLQHHPRG